MDKGTTNISLPTEDWHVICGWIESLINRGEVYVPTTAKELAEKLRRENFPVLVEPTIIVDRLPDGESPCLFYFLTYETCIKGKWRKSGGAIILNRDTAIDRYRDRVSKPDHFRNVEIHQTAAAGFL